jgi:hypothetical protein
MSYRRPLAVLSLAVAILAAGCGSGGGPSRSEDAATGTTTTPSWGQFSHSAPSLEALLPASIAGVRLEKGSTTGAAVFGLDAFSKKMTTLLAAVGKRPSDLRFANAQDPRGTLELEIGVFQVDGMSAAKLRRAIVASTRPNAPGLAVSQTAIGGKPVTVLVFPGGQVLYLYDQAGRVFYVGTQSRPLATKALGLLP